MWIKTASVAGSCEKRNEYSSYKTDIKYLDGLSNFYILKKASSPWSELSAGDLHFVSSRRFVIYP